MIYTFNELFKMLDWMDGRDVVMHGCTNSSLDGDTCETCRNDDCFIKDAPCGVLKRSEGRICIGFGEDELRLDDGDSFIMESNKFAMHKERLCQKQTSPITSERILKKKKAVRSS